MQVADRPPFEVAGERAIALTFREADRDDARALLEAIAEKLLASIVTTADPLLPRLAMRWSGAHAAQGSFGAQPPRVGLALPCEDEPPALTDFDLSAKEGRRGFLWALFHHHYRHGLLIAVNHAWAALARPRAVRCQIMAHQLKLPGVGKTALKNVLAAFLKEALYGVDFPPLPDLSGYPDGAAWHAACQQHFAIIDAKFEAIVGRYEAVLDGRKPDGAAAADVVINGPWLAAVDRKRPKSGS